MDFLKCTACRIDRFGQKPGPGIPSQTLDDLLCKKYPIESTCHDENPNVNYQALLDIWNSPTGDELEDLGFFDWIMRGPWGSDYLSQQEKTDIEVAIQEGVDQNSGETRSSMERYVKDLESATAKAYRNMWTRILVQLKKYNQGRPIDFLFPPAPDIPEASWFTKAVEGPPNSATMGIVDPVLISGTGSGPEYKRMGLSMRAALWDLPLGVPWPDLKRYIQNSIAIDEVLRDYGWPYEPHFKSFWAKRQFVPFAVSRVRSDAPIDKDDVRADLTLNILDNMEAILKDLEDYYKEKEKDEKQSALFQKIAFGAAGLALTFLGLPAIASIGFKAATTAISKQQALDAVKDLESAQKQFGESEQAFSKEIQWTTDRLRAMAGGGEAAGAAPSEGIPSWVWWTAGIAGAGLVGYILLRKRSSEPVVEAKPPVRRLAPAYGR